MEPEKSILSTALWNPDVDQDKYVNRDKYFDHILEQYKIYVEMADRISARRTTANTFFLTLNVLILSSVSIFIDSLIHIDNILLLFPLSGILLLCYTWWRLIKSYRQLNTAKYKVIGEIEKKLPSSPYYKAEWKALGEGKIPKLYTPLTRVENWIPVIFGCIYLFGCLYALITHFPQVKIAIFAN